jgi:carbon monoxide dehydrogenase subunit G
MLIEDRFSIAAPRERVWQAIRSPDIVASCVPGCRDVEIISPTSYKAKIRVQLGPIKAEFCIDIDVVSEIEMQEVRSRSRGEEGGRASSLSSENLLQLSAIDADTTELHYSSEVSVVGRLGKFGLGVMKKKAESLGHDFARALRQRIEHVGVET